MTLPRFLLATNTLNHRGRTLAQVRILHDCWLDLLGFYGWIQHPTNLTGHANS